MELLAVTDPDWVFPAVLVFMGLGFATLGTVWVRTTRKLNREVDADLAELRAITARQFPHSAAAVKAAKEAKDQLKTPAELRREALR